MSEDNTQNLDYIKTIFDHNQELIKLSDTKANIVLGINSILIPLIFGVTTVNFIDLLENNLLVHAILLNTFSIIGLVLLVISFVYSTLVIKARLSKELENNIFFENILKTKFEAYKTKILEMNDQAIKEDYLAEIYTLAGINKIKYSRYKWALRFLILGIFSLICGYFILAICNYLIITL